MVHIIIGPPCAGKSTYIKEHKHEGDLVIDYDVIAQALGASESHGSVGVIREVAFSARSAAVSKALEISRFNKEIDYWIIHSAPQKSHLKLYKSYAAEFILLNPGYQTVIDRAKRDHRPKGTEDWINKWYAWYVSNGTDFHSRFSSRQRDIINHMTDGMKNLIHDQDETDSSTGTGKSSRNW